MPKVSVIVPNYNHSKYLPKRLDSIFDQSFQDFEVILMDDASTDDSVDILKKYAKKNKVSHLVINIKNSGSTFKQWEKGIEIAQGKYIWIAESDDWAEKTFLEKIIPILEKDDNIGLAYSQSYVADENSDIIKNNIVWTDNFRPNKWKSDYINTGKDECINFLSYKNTIPNASAVVFRKKLVDANKIPVKMKMAGDWFFWVSILKKSNIAFVAKPLNFFRSTRESTRNHNSLYKKIQRKQEEIVVLSEIYSINKSVNYRIRLRMMELFSLYGIKRIFFQSFYWSVCFTKFPRITIKNTSKLFYLKFKSWQIISQ